MRAMSSWIATVGLCEMVIGGALAASACRSSSRHQAAKLVEQAHVYERGAGVARDYRAAADLLRAACDGGRGDVLACGAWLRAGWRARGTDRDMPSMHALATKIC